MNHKQADKSISDQIDAIIESSADWRGKMLSDLRAIINKADPAAIEEIKWRKPSKPSGVPVWSHEGIVCIADTLKSAVRLTFPKGAQLDDSRQLFNTRLDSKTVRAVDFYEDVTIDDKALKAMIIEAAKLNQLKKQKK